MKNYEFKLYRNTRKERYLRKLLVISNEIYNWTLACKKNSYQNNKQNISLYDMYNLIKKERNTNKLHWKKLNAQAIRQVVDRIYNGYTHFFNNLKLSKSQRRKISPPKLKPLRKQQSFTFQQNGYKLDQENSTVRIGKHTFKYHNQREVKGAIKTLTVKKNRLEEWFIYVVSDYEDPVNTEVRSVNSVGFDFGLHTFLTASTGNTEDDILSPLFFKQNIRQVKKLNRQLSSKQKGSNNIRKARSNLARQHKRITNQRKDFHWKLANQLVKKYSTIYLENLNLAGMKKLWGRKIHDLAFYDFLLKLKYVAVKNNCQVKFISRFYPSSKTCSNCGHYHKELQLRDREWTCSNCGVVHDRDLNAAINILLEGTRLDQEELKYSKGVGTSTLAEANVKPHNYDSNNQVFSVDSRI